MIVWRPPLNKVFPRTLRKYVEASATLSGMNYFKGQMLYRLGLKGHDSGATHVALSLDESLDYVSRVVRDYLTYAGVTNSFFRGKRILEIGPGDNLGVALCFLAMGARSVTCLDRFSSDRNEQHNAEIYEALVRQLDVEERERIHAAIDHDARGHVSFKRDRIEYRCGIPIEKAHRELAAPFDLIVSRAVLEHVYDLEAGWSVMVSLLSSSGQMWHKVDLRNHQFFDQLHPLYFLTVKERLWRAISSPDPTLNRQLLPTYRRLLSQSFNDWTLYYTSLMGRDGELVPHQTSLTKGIDYDDRDIDSVSDMRPFLAHPFQDMSNEELLTSGIFLIARRTERGQ